MESRMDMINGSLGDKIIKYALPLAVTGVLQQLFNAADLAVVGQFSGKEAMAAVGSNAPVIGLLVNLFVGISLGSNVIIARSIGQKDHKSISKAVHTSIIVALLGGVGILAGLSAKNKGIFTIAIQWKDGKKSLIEIDDKLYKKFINEMF